MVFFKYFAPTNLDVQIVTVIDNVKLKGQTCIEIVKIIRIISASWVGAETSRDICPPGILNVDLIRIFLGFFDIFYLIFFNF